MPWNLHPVEKTNKAKIQFVTFAAMPHLIYQACQRAGFLSNTVYIQHAVCRALARDLGVPLDTLLSELPTPRGPAAHLYDPAEGTMSRYGNNLRGRSVEVDQSGGIRRIGPANTHESVPEREQE